MKRSTTDSDNDTSLKLARREDDPNAANPLLRVALVAEMVYSQLASNWPVRRNTSRRDVLNLRQTCQRARRLYWQHVNQIREAATEIDWTSEPAEYAEYETVDAGPDDDLGIMQYETIEYRGDRLTKTLYTFGNVHAHESWMSNPNYSIYHSDVWLGGEKWEFMLSLNHELRSGIVRLSNYQSDEVATFAQFLEIAESRMPPNLFSRIDMSGHPSRPMYSVMFKF